MRTYEHIKTGLLIGLVGLSLILTWKLWTFQPDIALLDNTSRYIPSEVMSEERKLADVIQPQFMVVHQQEKYAMISPKDGRFDQLYEKLLASTLEESEQGTRIARKRLDGDGIEVMFPTEIPAEIFLSLFQLSREEHSLPTGTINSIFLYGDKKDEQVYMQLLSKKEEQVVEMKTNLSLKELTDSFIAKFDEYIEVVKVESESNENPPGNIYLPVNPVAAEKLSFTVSPISGQFFRQTLFTDPASVKYYRQTDGEESYTDGNRIINIRNNGLFMEYNNPVYSDKDRSSKHIIQGSYEFINGHGGWTNTYFLTDWVSTDRRDVAEYRLRVNKYPVISFKGLDQMLLRISRSGNQTESYFRPLFNIDNQPIDAKETVELRSGLDVIERLKQHETFELSQLQKVIIGYEMTMPNRSFVTVEPNWFVLYDNRWQKITFTDEEGGRSNGLE
ncbi:hypothetical protein GN156_07330 [bacterium LRH843]|nr:hypothetical protein [bacterium LRH843]